MANHFTLAVLALTNVALVLASRLRDGGTNNWDYDQSYGKLDPSKWHELPHNGNCSQSRQSPINIVDSAIVRDNDLGSIRFLNYQYAVTNATMLNDGKTLKVVVPNSRTSPRIQVEGGTYRLFQFHFHWPSEHTVNGQRYPLELHLVHYNEKYSESEAPPKSDGLVVVAILFDQKSGTPIRGNAFQTIVSNIENIDNEGEHVAVPDMVPEQLLPWNVDSYVRYSGSLTTPPCYQTVEFHILTETLRVSNADVQHFKTMLHKVNKGELPINHNERPLQPLNNRRLRLFGDMGTLNSRL